MGSITLSQIGQWLKDNILLFASILTALGVVWKMIGVPLRKLIKSFNGLQSDVSDLMWDRLVDGHDRLLMQGWATTADKERLCSIYRHYKATGRNHIADSYEHDIINLPERPRQEGD